MRFVTRRAGNSLFAVFVAKEVRRALKHTFTHVRMTRKAGVGFVSEFEQFGFGLHRIKGQRKQIRFARFLSARMMRRMTTDARQAARFVFAAAPLRVFVDLRMARLTAFDRFFLR